MSSISRAGTFSLGDRTVHRLGYGAMQLAGPGVFGPPKDREGALAVLRAAVAAGVDHIDTSDFYGPHITNQLIREALSPYGQDLTLVTKIGALRGPDGAWLLASSPAELEQAVHDNLRNLGREVLDVVNLRIMFDTHGPAEGSIEEQLTALATLQQQGLVRHIGLSNVTRTQVAEGRRICPIVCVQNQYNLVHRADDALIDELAVDGIAYVPFFPLGGFTAAAVVGAVGCRTAVAGHADAGGAGLAAAPGTQHLADSGHFVGRPPAREPGRCGARSAGRGDGGAGAGRGQPEVVAGREGFAYRVPPAIR